MGAAKKAVKVKKAAKKETMIETAVSKSARDEMKLAINTAAKQVLLGLKSRQIFSKSKVQKATHEAVWTVLAKEINKMSTAAAVQAVVHAKKRGFNPQQAQLAVAKAAQDAAMKAKEYGIRWAVKAERDAIVQTQEEEQRKSVKTSQQMALMAILDD